MVVFSVPALSSVQLSQMQEDFDRSGYFDQILIESNVRTFPATS